MGEPTPRRWYHNGIGEIYAEDRAARKKPIAQTVMYPAASASEEEIANAELVVRAVNAHEALIEALKTAASELENHERTDTGWKDTAVLNVLDEVRAAIALADAPTGIAGYASYLPRHDPEEKPAP